MKFEIDRATWRQGSLSFLLAGSTKLLNEKGFCCCLGFLGKACGYKNEQLFDVGLPTRLHNRDTNNISNSLWPKGLLEAQREFTRINDYPEYTNEERETKLTEQFKKINIDVEFTGEYPA